MQVFANLESLKTGVGRLDLGQKCIMVDDEEFTLTEGATLRSSDEGLLFGLTYTSPHNDLVITWKSVGSTWVPSDANMVKLSTPVVEHADAPLEQCMLSESYGKLLDTAVGIDQSNDDASVLYVNKFEEMVDFGSVRIYLGEKTFVLPYDITSKEVIIPRLVLESGATMHVRASLKTTQCQPRLSLPLNPHSS